MSSWNVCIKYRFPIGLANTINLITISFLTCDVTIAETEKSVTVQNGDASNAETDDNDNGML